MLITLTSNVFLSPKPRKRTEFYSIMTPPTWWKAKTGGAWRHLTILACLGGETSRKLQVTVRGWWHMQVCNAEDSFGRKHQFQDFVSFGYDSLFLSSCQLWSYAVIPISSCDTCRDFFFFFVFLICQDILGEASWTVSSRLQASAFGTCRWGPCLDVVEDAELLVMYPRLGWDGVQNLQDLCIFKRTLVREKLFKLHYCYFLV